MSTVTATVERKPIDLRIKSLGDGAGPGTFSIYALAYGNVDRQGEKILPGAVRNIDEFLRDGFLALSHDMKALPLGTIDRVRSDSYGLLVDGTFHTTPEAQACRTVMRERMARGKSVKASIGYIVTEDARGFEGGKSFRLLKGIELLELSVVAIPANPLAHAVEVKGAGGGKARPESPIGDKAVAELFSGWADEIIARARRAQVVGYAAKARELRRRRILLKARVALMDVEENRAEAEHTRRAMDFRAKLARLGIR